LRLKGKDSVVKVEPVARTQIDALATLLAESHQGSTGSGARHVLADEAMAIQAVTAAVAAGPGVAAFDGPAAVGYMIAPLPARPGTTTARLGVTHHAAHRTETRLIYRRMYEALSAKLVELGCTYHSLPVVAEHADVVSAFFELEFGIDQIDGMLRVPETADRPEGGSAVRFATASDLDRIVELAIELAKYHSRAPMFQVALLDASATRRDVEAALADERSTVVVAEMGERIVAMATAGPDKAYLDTFDIGMNSVTAGARRGGVGTAMLNFLLAWGASRGYRHCTVGWTSSNLGSDAFYRSRGFTPVRYRLHRRIDDRVSWANEGLDYAAFHR
jgi:GNAT superfamily N-acetyltransferase